MCWTPAGRSVTTGDVLGLDGRAVSTNLEAQANSHNSFGCRTAENSKNDEEAKSRRNPAQRGLTSGMAIDDGACVIPQFRV